MLIGFGLALLIGVPVIWGQARNDPRAGDRANWARGGYAVLSSLSMSLFGLVGLGMLIFGQPVDEDGDTYRVPDSPLQVRIFGAVLFLMPVGVVIYGAYRRRGPRCRARAAVWVRCCRRRPYSCCVEARDREVAGELAGGRVQIRAGRKVGPVLPMRRVTTSADLGLRPPMAKLMK